MIASMSHGGKIAALGIPAKSSLMDWRPVIFNMMTIKGIYGREMYETWYKMSVMLESGRGHFPGDHTPLWVQGLSGGLCGDDFRPNREGSTGLDKGELS